ncbi:DUF3416 domain-containing protein [Nakamurella sp. YIM 132087]|uniref:Alpha-1,4-glucan:maltose-1-phosphate maltosyltransferase n=1 Tax=Nakamurella alba TaxID=2665158 RepID=A0A7K1FRE8_9ACTN|nr:alpha-1,4-glucan--maltose-1-phosphate maltosyltransferase [Nakamurella alba]MTD16721.1 DUF3416 domain-containing protein [Nakamurella alba]
MAGRIGLTDIGPSVAGGRYPAKASVGESIEITATVFREGHDAVAANVVWRPPPAADAVRRRGGNREAGPLLRMKAGTYGTDRWSATVVPDRMGMWSYVVEAWSDPLATWRHAVEAKAAVHQTGEEMANDLETGARLLERIARRPGQQYATAIRAAVEALRDPERSVTERIGPALSTELWPVLTADPIRELITRSSPQQVWVDRQLAEFGSWYEFFPRSINSEIDADGRPLRHGTFADATTQLPRVAAMGFDVVYLPPIHPIGELNRKGRNNTVTHEDSDVGSPWAIGSAAGGHDAIHPELGTIEDFDAFVAATNELGMTVAMDLALQCAPDHPWVAEHPDWFTVRPDGSIAYAENPPKKYQDIYPLDFDKDTSGLYAEVLRVVEHWISHGISVFRVDNPHTKPINFWEWLITQVHLRHPEVIFLAEAFTKPAMMHELARVGFTQSYTYFTWRVTKAELIEYGVELVQGSDHMRPNFFVNTPDINPFHLQSGEPAWFALRAVLAATLVPTWGVYAGYELFEHEALAPGREEYKDSEKFQLRPRDFDAALAEGRSLEPLFTRLNQIRREHRSLQYMKGLWFHGIANDNLLCYSKRHEASGDVTLMVVAVNPGNHWGTTDLHLPSLGLDWTDTMEAVDELSGEVYHWGQFNTVNLDTASRVAHIFRIRKV